MAMLEDFTAFFSTDEFASDATLGGQAVRGIFDKAYQLGDVGGNGMASTQPTLTLATQDVPANAVGLAVFVGGTAYTIATHEPDGTGLSLLLLERP